MGQYKKLFGPPIYDMFALWVFGIGVFYMFALSISSPILSCLFLSPSELTGENYSENKDFLSLALSSPSGIIGADP